MEEKSYITEEKRQALLDELNHLKTIKRKEILESLEAAKALGDLSENAEYHQAREEQAMVEDRIRYLENLLKNARLVGVTENGIIAVGSTVRLERTDGDTKSLLFTIVGSEEADMTRGMISNMSPIGSALIGHKKGDKVKVQTPKGAVEYIIAKIK